MNTQSGRVPQRHGSVRHQRVHDEDPMEHQGIEDDLMPWETRSIPVREMVADWLAETGTDKWLDLLQIVFRCDCACPVLSAHAHDMCSWPPTTCCEWAR